MNILAPMALASQVHAFALRPHNFGVHYITATGQDHNTLKIT